MLLVALKLIYRYFQSSVVHGSQCSLKSKIVNKKISKSCDTFRKLLSSGQLMNSSMAYAAFDYISSNSRNLFDAVESFC